MNEEELKKLAFEYFMQTPIGAKYQEALAALEQIQNFIVAYQDKSDEKGLMAVKAGTTIVLSILRKIAGGKKIKEFAKEDWLDIANNTAVNAVLLDDGLYSKLIFGLYADYIEFSAIKMKGLFRDDKIVQIQGLAEELRAKARVLEEGKISEVDYTENCLWICLEAMIKLLAADSSIFLGIKTSNRELSEDAQKLIENMPEIVGMFAFEYARYKLYEKEQALLAQYLEQQSELDEELSKKYAIFKEELEREVEGFKTLMDSAFNPDFRASFMGAIQLAKKAGVASEDILSSIADVDDYFS